MAAELPKTALLRGRGWQHEARQPNFASRMVFAGHQLPRRVIVFGLAGRCWKNFYGQMAPMRWQRSKNDVT